MHGGFMNFNHYFTNEEVEQTLKDWEITYPNIVKVSQIGSSHEDHPIWLLTLTNLATGTASEKPALWIDGNIHATELTGTTAALYIAYALINGYTQNGSPDHTRITRLLDTCAFYIVPRVNPDGAAWALAPNPRFVRSGVRPYPWEEKEEGIHAQDIDNDGRIVQMRIPDPNGDWKVSSLDPRLMEKRGIDDNGSVYFRLLPEGILEDYDGYIIREARDLQGLDFNRNFPYEWKPENDQFGAGPFPSSEPETRALTEYLSKTLNVNVVLTFHTFSRVLLRPYSTRADDTMDQNDLWVFKKMGERGTALTGYRCVSTFHDFTYNPKEVTYGAFDDWMYDHLGAFSFTVELWDLPTEAGIKDRKFTEWGRDHPHEQDAQILKWIDEHGESDSYLPWKQFDHPQLGKVEIGGWNTLYSWRNPPHAYAEAEVSRHLSWVLALSETLPRLAIHTQEVAPLGNDTYRLNLVVENIGFLPTYTSQQAQKRRCVRPVRVELDLPDNVKLLNGKRRSELGHLEGRSNKLGVTATYAGSPTDNRARVEWVISAPKGTAINVSILSERAGSIKLKVILP
jgi:murein tripeptide amidase MpaA